MEGFQLKTSWKLFGPLISDTFMNFLLDRRLPDSRKTGVLTCFTVITQFINVIMDVGMFIGGCVSLFVAVSTSSACNVHNPPWPVAKA